MGFLRPRRQKPPEKSWTVVADCTSSFEAEVIAGLLRTAEIPVFIQQDGAARAMGITMGLGAIRVLVPTPYEAEAMALLAEDETPPLIDEPAIQFPDGYDEDDTPDDPIV
ncbi:MAG: DUF2007 domain-containing protein [Chloroflexi bacterium]|nr:DUF2007 domain-containing protein [Chloroflexota bacterium]